MVTPTSRAAGSRYSEPSLLALDSAPNVLVLFFASSTLGAILSLERHVHMITAS